MLARFGVEEFGGVGGFALDAEQDVEGGGASWGDGHRVSLYGRSNHNTEEAEDAEFLGRSVKVAGFVAPLCDETYIPSFSPAFGW
jgi:hypothetical protein